MRSQTRIQIPTLKNKNSVKFIIEEFPARRRGGGLFISCRVLKDREVELSNGSEELMISMIFLWFD